MNKHTLRAFLASLLSAHVGVRDVLWRWFVRKRISLWMRVACLLAVLPFASEAHAQTETVLYRFGGIPSDGYEPGAPLLMDSSGNLFGTTSGGGTGVLCADPTGPNPCGTVFELVNSSGRYTERVIHNFTGPLSDGDEPLAGLIMDSSGNLYGTTGYGGSGLCGATTCGSAFELVPSPAGYSENILHMFGGFEGGFILTGLLRDSSGNLYGVANGGGSNGYGCVFELVYSSGTYTATVLYSFGAGPTDGEYPVGGILMDSAGNIFGTTSEDGGPFSCGLSSCGTVFELVKTPNGYTEKVLYTFHGPSGANPLAGLVMDSSGNLYGTTSNGGAFGFGTVFELVYSSGTYTEKVLHSFGASPADGTYPVATLVMDSVGDIFGTTKMGGSLASCGGFGCGTVFELAFSSGQYAEKILHVFGGAGDGVSPGAALIMDAAGNLYGTTEVGGSYLQLGTVFTIDPIAPAPDVALSPPSLTFSNQVLGTSSSPQTVSLTNTGAADLIFGLDEVTLSGSNAADFLINGDTCRGATIPRNSTCSLSVTFAPSLAATETAALTFADNAPVSLQTVSLAGMGLNTSASVTLSPFGLTFAPQTVSTASAPQNVSLTNSGDTLLTITSISASPGFNETNNCGSTVAPGASCSIQLTFVPTQAGPDSGALSVADSAPATPQTAALFGVGEDFYLNVASGSLSATVSPGSSAGFSLSLAPQDGFNQTVSFACTGAPLRAACSVSPSGVTPDGVEVIPITVTVSTTAPTLVPPRDIWPPNNLPSVFSLIILDLLLIFAVRRVADLKMNRAIRNALSALLLLAAVLGISSCGGGSGGSSQGAPGTPAGTYTLTVTATSGTLSRSVVLTLNVN